MKTYRGIILIVTAIILLIIPYTWLIALPLFVIAVIFCIHDGVIYFIRKKTEYEYHYKEYYDIKREVEEIEKDLYSERDWEE